MTLRRPSPHTSTSRPDFVAPEEAHFGRVEGPTIVQLPGPGPFETPVVEGQEMTPWRA